MAKLHTMNFTHERLDIITQAISRHISYLDELAGLRESDGKPAATIRAKATALREEYTRICDELGR